MDRMPKSSFFQKEIDFSSCIQLENVFRHFSDNNSISLSADNFKNMMSELLVDSSGKSLELSETKTKQLFDKFDTNKDGVIDQLEFSEMAKNFIQPLLKPVTALLIIDVQNDFIDGSLALKNCPAKQDGKEVISVINNLLEIHDFNVVVFTKDYHPENHISFFSNHHRYKLSEKSKSRDQISLFDSVIFEEPREMPQKLWPVHCVQNTWGCELHRDLKSVENSLTIYKGTNPSVDSYSAFFDNLKLSKTDLDEELRNKKVTHVFVCGLAFDYCVSYTAMDAVELGYATVVIKDATRGTDHDNMKVMEEKLKSQGCVIANSNEIENLMSGKDIRSEFIFTLKSPTKNS